MIHILKGFAATPMTYTAWSFLLLVAIVYTFYYLVPTKMQWYVLLIGSSIFYLNFLSFSHSNSFLRATGESGRSFLRSYIHP